MGNYRVRDVPETPQLCLHSADVNLVISEEKKSLGLSIRTATGGTRVVLMHRPPHIQYISTSCCTYSIMPRHKASAAAMFNYAEGDCCL